MILSNADTVAGSCEIVEVNEDCNMNEKVRKHNMSRQGRVYSVEDDINQLFDSVNIKTSMKGKAVQRNPMKKPIRVDPPQDLETGISETVNLKQALRGLCISQASEMAALKKRTLKPRGSSGMSDAGTSNQFHKAIVVHAKESDPPTNGSQKNILEIAFPGKIVANLSETTPEHVEMSAPTSLNLTYKPSTPLAQADISKNKIVRVPSQDKIVPLASESTSENSSMEQVQKSKLKLKDSLRCTIKNVLEVDDSSFANTDKDQSQTNVLNLESCQASGGIEEKVKNKSSSPRLMKPIFWNKNLVKRKIKAESEYASCKTHAAKEVVEKDLSHSAMTNELVGKVNTCTINNEGGANEKSTAVSNSETASQLSSSGLDARVNQLLTARVNDTSSSEIGKADSSSKSRAKGELSHSSKSSIGEFSSSTSDESSSSGSSRCCNRPHMSKDTRWEAIHCVQKQHGFLSLRHFKLLRRLGSGDIGTVYLAELVGTKHFFALKVMDNEFLTRRKKLERAQTEREILQMLDHPFLPTLYSHFVTDKLSCLVMEYCPGGDLHAIRQKQQNRCFSEHAARFYCAEVLLALEYLHMLGIVYRDLKPENILVREDGHIMLSDFDLSLRSVVNPTLFRSSSPIMEPAKISTSLCSESSCIDPFCVQSSWQISCFTPRLLTAPSKTRKQKNEQAVQVTPLPQLVAEPTEARSHSFVGTHEYLAPEIVKGEGHGSAVDWWTFGIFLYEVLYGKTPFKGSSNEETLANVVSLPLRFPETPLVSFHAKDLVRGLLDKQPQNRLGFVRGAAEVKQHPFFEGLNWALIRCAVPPERPKFRDVGKRFPSSKKHTDKSVGVQCSKDIEFELF